MLSDTIFHQETNQPSINKICNELHYEIRRYYQLLSDIQDTRAELWSFENTILPLISLQERIDGLSCLLKFFSQVKTGLNAQTEENIQKTHALLFKLIDDCAHSHLLLEIYQAAQHSGQLNSEQQGLIDGALKNMAPLLRLNASSNVTLKKLVNDIDSVIHRSLKHRESFLKNWVFSLHPEDIINFDEQSLSILKTNATRLNEVLMKKFGDMSPSDYAVSLDKKISEIVLKFGPKPLRKRVFEGRKKLTSMASNESYDREILERIIEIITLRQQIAATCGFESFADFSEYLRPLSIDYSTLQATYRKILPIVSQKAQQELELLKDFALEHDSALDFESSDLIYYSHLAEQKNCAHQASFEITRAINLINEKMLQIFGLSLRMIEHNSQSPNLIVLELFDPESGARVGTIQCDLFNQIDKKKRTEKKIFIVENFCVESPLAVFICSFFEQKEHHSLSFWDILSLSKDIGTAVGLLLWRRNSSNRLMLNMVSDDMYALLALIFASWHLDRENLATHYPSIDSAVLDTLLQAHERREAFTLLQDLQFSYFDSILHSALYTKLLSENTDKYSPHKLWESICQTYNPEAKETIAWNISPLSEDGLLGKSFLPHISIISKIYFAQLSATLEQAPCLRSAGSVLYNCFFGDPNPSTIAEKLQHDFFKERVSPLYLAALYQSDEEDSLNNSENSAIIFSQATQPPSIVTPSHKK